MSHPAYKTNRLLWIALTLLIFLFWFYGIDEVIALFSGKLRVDDLMSFESVGPLVFSIVAGWLLQCAIVIVWSWKRKKAKPPR
jgi:hypothetical protein